MMPSSWDPAKYGLQKHKERLAQQQSQGSTSSPTYPHKDSQQLKQQSPTYQTEAIGQQPNSVESKSSGVQRSTNGPDAKEASSTSIPTSPFNPTPIHLVMNVPGLSKDEALDAQEQLLAATQGALREISSRAKRVSKYDTSALKDLALARSPVDQTKPHKSRRPWAVQAQPILGLEYAGTVGPKDLQLAPPSLPSRPQDVRKSRWASKEETKFVKPLLGSNDWGSVASDGSYPSNESDVMFGKLVHHPTDERLDVTLHNWDGDWLPPDAEWQTRPRFHNNTKAFKQSFKCWHASISSPQGEFSNGNALTIITKEQLRNPDLVPDGIAFISRTIAINRELARYYGYVENITDLELPDPPSASDDPTSSKVDMNDTMNYEYAADTTEMYVQNWLAHADNCRKAGPGPGLSPGLDQPQPTPTPFSRLNESSEDSDDAQVPEVGEETNIVPTGWAPKLNIFLRPAMDGDIKELMRIYNWYVQNSPRPSETTNITQTSMEYRLQSSKDSRLPFFVAVAKSKKDILLSSSPIDQAYVLNQRPNHRQRGRGEKLVGFCCVQDFSCADFVEHISAEVEIYVDGSVLHQGVGRCLLDKVLEVCDFGYLPHRGYSFVCPEQEQHLYGTGGGRDVHKLWFVIRNYHKPRASKLKPSSQNALKNTAFVKTDENFDLWLRPWLESYGFEVEGHLRRSAAKQGRYVDTIYLGRETSWKPDEGTVPDPLPYSEDQYD